MSRTNMFAVTAAAFLIGVGIDLVIGYSPIPGYGAGLGLFGCIAIVVVSKWLGKIGLQQPEDHYPEDHYGDDLPTARHGDAEDAARG